MPKTIELSIRLDENSAVTTVLYKRDFRNAMYLASKLIPLGAEKMLLSALTFPAVWTVECALWRRSQGDEPFAHDAVNPLEAFDQITRARDDCHENARRIVLEEIKACAASGKFEPLPKYKLKKHHDLSSMRSFVLIDDLGCTSADVTLFDAVWVEFEKACMEAGAILTPSAETAIDWSLRDILNAVQDAITRRDYSALLEGAFSCDLRTRSELLDAISTISKRRFLT